jgi:hypothetical protein
LALRLGQRRRDGGPVPVALRSFAAAFSIAGGDAGRAVFLAPGGRRGEQRNDGDGAHARVRHI